jgi:FkbM family methyltransferase
MPVDVSLPNGAVVSCLQKHEVPLVQLEIETYFTNGIKLKPGDTVFDVGANIGLFSLAAYERCGHDLRVFAFEPVDAIFQVLRSNLERRTRTVLANTLPYGLSNSSRTIQFAYYPGAPVLSTAYPDETADLAVVKDAVLNSIIHLDQAPLAVRCLRWLPKALGSLILDCALRWTLRRKTVNCQLRTLSQVVRDHGVERIDMLKIDVEKAELDVLLGVEDGDWAKIQQIVIDVHDDDDRLGTVIALLRKHGLTEITVEQPPTLKNSGIYTVFALRIALPESLRTPMIVPETAEVCV